MWTVWTFCVVTEEVMWTVWTFCVVTEEVMWAVWPICVMYVRSDVDCVDILCDD